MGGRLKHFPGVEAKLVYEKERLYVIFRFQITHLYKNLIQEWFGAQIFTYVRANQPIPTG